MAAPLEAGAVQVIVAEPVPTTTLETTGWLGGAAGVTRAADEAAELPAEFVAVMVTEYDVPLVRPGMVALVAVAGSVKVCVVPPAVTAITYEVIFDPPVAEPVTAAQVTMADWLPARASTLVGAAGGVDGVSSGVAFDGVPVPVELVAVTVKA